MSITITTSEYTRTKSAVIDGIAFEVRQMSSAETLSLSALLSEIKDGASDPKKAEKTLNKIEELYFGCYDKPEEAKKVIGNLPFDTWFEIYNKIIKEA